MKLVVGYLASSGGADALALGARFARTLGAELELCIVLPPDRVAPSIKPVGDFEKHLVAAGRGVAGRRRGHGAGRHRGPHPRQVRRLVRPTGCSRRRRRSRPT